MSCNNYTSLHGVTEVAVTHWNKMEASPSHSCTMTIVFNDGTSMQIVLFAPTPFAVKTPDYQSDVLQSYAFGIEEGRELEREACAKWLESYDEGFDRVADELRDWRGK